MRVVVQRCSEACVKVDERIVGKIDRGVVLLVCFTKGDTLQEIEYMVDKILHLRIFDDLNGVMNLSLLDIGGSVLSISQFTLYADTRKGRRPSYVQALNGEEACTLYHQFNELLKENLGKVETGIFGADMKVTFTNDGPVTIMLEKEGNRDGK